MNPTQIKQPRLSEESTTESTSTSVSGDSEADRQTDEDSAAAGTAPINTTGPWATEAEFLRYAMTIPEIAGRYTDADPAFRDDVEDKTPPILENYAPRKHDRDRPGGGGYGQQGGYHQYNRGQGQNYGNNRGYSNHGNHYRNNNRHGGHGGHGGQGQQHHYRNNPRSASEGSSSGGGGGGGDGGGHQNRYHDQRGGSEGAPRGFKRKSDHSHSLEPGSQFYARPIGNKVPRRSSNDEDDVAT